MFDRERYDEELRERTEESIRASVLAAGGKIGEVKVLVSGLRTLEILNEEGELIEVVVI